MEMERKFESKSKGRIYHKSITPMEIPNPQYKLFTKKAAMIPEAYLEPDHAAPGASRRAGLHLSCSPTQRVETVTDSERGRQPPRERYVYGEVEVAGLCHLIHVDHDARAPPGRA